VLSHSYGAALDNPNLLVISVVGDGEAETGPLATSWHLNKFINPQRDGIVLPVLLLNDYKINNPPLLSRIEEEEPLSLFKGYSYEPRLVATEEDIMQAHQYMAEAMSWAVERMLEIKGTAKKSDFSIRPHYPMVILDSSYRKALSPDFRRAFAPEPTS